MHEMSIAEEIIDIIRLSVPDGKSNLVLSVRLSVGSLSNIMPDSLKFCFDALCLGTDLEHSQMIIDEIPILIKCKSCLSESRVEDLFFICPECFCEDVELLSGRELSVDSIELADIKEEQS